jgi:hypothetical protein
MAYMMAVSKRIPFVNHPYWKSYLINQRTTSRRPHWASLQSFVMMVRFNTDPVTQAPFTNPESRPEAVAEGTDYWANEVGPWDTWDSWDRWVAHNHR